jgi:predicted enzyme related to lactoylglutathione lyase
MHKSKLCSLGIDCQADDLVAASQFWSRALGMPAPDGVDPRTERYVTLGKGDEHPIVFLQRVDHPSRVHLDIEADDVEKEAARLEALGAKRIEKRNTWWVMEAPTGHRFCVIRVQRGAMPADANNWET